MTRLAVACLAAALVPGASAATITGTISAGPGTSLFATNSFTFYVGSAGIVSFSAGFDGISPGCTQKAAGAWGCVYDVNDRITSPGAAFGAVVSGSASIGNSSLNDITPSTLCGGPIQGGIASCSQVLAPGAYAMNLQIQESVDTQRLLNSAATPGSRTLSITISGPGVLVSPEPGTLGLAGLALAGLLCRGRLKQCWPRMNANRRE